MIEAQSLGNAILKKQEAHQEIVTPSTGQSSAIVNASNVSINQTEETALYTDIPDITITDTGVEDVLKSPFDISKRVEVSALAEIFLGVFYVIIRCVFFYSID